MNNYSTIECDNFLYNNTSVWQNVFAQSHPESLKNLESVCKAFYHLSTDNSPNIYPSNVVWKEAIIRQFPTVGKVIRLWDDQRFGYLAQNSYKELYKQLFQLNAGQLEKTEHQNNCIQRYQYLSRVLKIFEGYTTQLKPEKVSLSYDQIWLTPEENLKWCHQNNTLSFKKRQSYAYMFLKDSVKRLMDETRIKMNRPITQKRKRNTPSSV